jgi:uncharacterized protein (UPF0261 family)
MMEAKMPKQSENLWTVARIANHLNVARHRVEYVIVTRGIAPIDRAGIARVFDSSDIPIIAKSLHQIAAEREGECAQ